MTKKIGGKMRGGGGECHTDVRDGELQMPEARWLHTHLSIAFPPHTLFFHFFSFYFFFLHNTADA
jgi:hypothetical protein